MSCATCRFLVAKDGKQFCGIDNPMLTIDEPEEETCNYHEPKTEE